MSPDFRRCAWSCREPRPWLHGPPRLALRRVAGRGLPVALVVAGLAVSAAGAGVALPLLVGCAGPRVLRRAPVVPVVPVVAGSVLGALGAGVVAHRWHS